MNTAEATDQTAAPVVNAERAIVASALQDDDALSRVVEIVAPAQFEDRRLGLIYWAATQLFENGEIVDAITVAEKLNRNGYLEKVGGEIAIHQLAAEPAPVGVEQYGRIVRDRSTRRELGKVGATIASLAASTGGETADQLLDKAQQAVFELSDQATQSGPEATADLMGDVLALIDERRQTGGGITGVESGYADLDEMTGGYNEGDLVVVAGRPSMGKTAQVVGSAVDAALRGEPVLFFSLEMNKASLVIRMISKISMVPLRRILRGEITENDFDGGEVAAVRDAAAKIAAAPIWIDDTPGLSLLQMRSRVRRWRLQHPAAKALVVVDYLQLMTPPKAENRTQEVSQISSGLKRIAREFSVPVVALSQLSRSVEARVDKRPMMSDLRESGSIEQDADLIVFMYRPEYYMTEEEVARRDLAGCGEAIIAKQRNGATGTVYLYWDGKRATYRTATHAEQERWRADARLMAQKADQIARARSGSSE